MRLMSNLNFLKQTAKDYDIELHIVESIYSKYPDNFYEMLEDYLRTVGRNNG